MIGVVCQRAMEFGDGMRKFRELGRVRKSNLCYIRTAGG